MEGYQIPLEHLFATHLENALSEHPVEIINLSVGGYGTLQEYLYLREEGLKYQPDLILLAFPPGNDLWDNSIELQMLYLMRFEGKAKMRPYAVAGEDKQLQVLPSDPRYVDVYANWRRSTIESSGRLAFWNKLLIVRYAKAHFTQEIVPIGNPNVRYGAYISNYDPALYPAHDVTQQQYKTIWERSWRTTQQLILSIADLANRIESDFAVLTVPARIQTDTTFRKVIAERYPTLSFDFERIDQAAEKFASEHKIKLLNLAPVFARHHATVDEALFFGEEDQHWNRAGHHKAAHATAQFVNDCFLDPSPGRC